MMKANCLADVACSSVILLLYFVCERVDVLGGVSLLRALN